ncbi:---NA--- [Paramuricea clavata]|uniref:---NA n=1 Tax=Paramuricea clavata TaxID=317549 RepID=A0A7D9JF52_PARCT|nr:---NA--- [Paramuricea clavata]
MLHSTLHDSLIVYSNDGLWSVKEKEEIIDCVEQIYLKTNNNKRKQKLDEEIAGDKPQEMADPLAVDDDSDTASDVSFSDEEFSLSESNSD